MLVKEAKTIARQWVIEEAANTPGFAGAFFHGSINWLSDDATMPATSDLDLILVLDDANLPDKPGTLSYGGVLIQGSYISSDQLRSPEQVLGVSHLAGSLHVPSVIADPTGHLTRLQAAVAKEYARRKWVYRRCEHARGKVLANLRALDDSAPLHDQVLAWLFAAGVTTHILLVAGLKNPTVKRRYLAVRALLDDYGRLDFYPKLLEMLGCAQLSRERVEHHLADLIEAFDSAKTVIKTPFSFASEISNIARPMAIDGSRDLIEQGYHREAVFWIAVTYSRCQKVLYHDAAPEMQQRFTPGYLELLSDLGVTSFSDLLQRGEEIRDHLLDVWDVAAEIIEANPEIED